MIFFCAVPEGLFWGKSETDRRDSSFTINISRPSFFFKKKKEFFFPSSFTNLFSLSSSYIHFSIFLLNTQSKNEKKNFFFAAQIG
ncbi:unnamed protein product [Meloidogyne enterolobii]|uniref:Uncharacterized protein n=1 Tax=Meloidogyne enterolobii TaxID=390850 RepID=A0ACB0XUN8_MELEN